VRKGIISAVRRVEFVNDRMSYIVLRGHSFDIIISNVHAPKEDKIDHIKDTTRNKNVCLINSLNAICPRLDKLNA
jgi:hypothetical protein